MINSGMLMLREMLDLLPKSEKKLASYILEHPEEVPSLTVSELGKKSQTSGAAVIRLCKSLNLKGFQDLKIRIAGDLQRDLTIEHRDIEPNESCESIINKVTANSIQTIDETSNLLNVEQLDKAVQTILKANNIHLFGVGASAIAAVDAQQKFLRINKNATAFNDLHMAATIVANSKENDVVIGISFSGETKEVKQILEIAKERRVKTISLTKYGISPVSEIADIKLFTSVTKEATFRSGATSSRLAQLHVIDILFMCVASNTYKETIEYLDTTRDVIKSLNSQKKRSKKMDRE